MKDTKGKIGSARVVVDARHGFTNTRGPKLSRAATTCNGVAPLPMSPLEAACIVSSLQQNEEIMRPGELARRNELFKLGRFHPSLSDLALLSAQVVSGGGVIQA